MKQQTILIGVTGGVAAYKVVEIASSLRKQGHTVRVAMTDAAQKFVTPTTFSAVSGHAALTTLWPKVEHGDLEVLYPHLYPATDADVFLLAPATADMIGQIALGLGKDVVSTSALSLPDHCTKVFCPAMNLEMWNNPHVQRNCRTLEEHGWIRLGPESGHLACGMEGAGRMREPADILLDLDSLFDRDTRLKGKSVLVVSGPTREHFDPIRYIGNPSSGLMGQAVAQVAARHSATVQFVTGPVPTANLPHGHGIHLHKVTSAEEMLREAERHVQDVDAIVYVAAVADYRPAKLEAEKLPKHTDAFQIELLPNPDIAATINAKKRSDTLAIGFALQTKDGEPYARRKLERKHLDGIVLNYADSLGSHDGEFSFLGVNNDNFETWGRIPKGVAAEHIIAKVLNHIEGK